MLQGQRGPYVLRAHGRQRGVQPERQLQGTVVHAAAPPTRVQPEVPVHPFVGHDAAGQQVQHTQRFVAGAAPKVLHYVH